MIPLPFKPTTVSLFCGGGGESAGKDLAFRELGLDPATMINHALNHWQTAVEVHGINFPAVDVHREDITAVTAGTYGLSKINLLWASPSCVHFSRARGGQPKSDQQRSHAQEVLDRWIRAADVDVFLMENVAEFATWGPLYMDHSHGCDGSGVKCRKGCHFGRPIPELKGTYFQAFLRDLRALGYQVEHRVITAADYGDATIRRRFFMQAAKDGKPMVWANPTHRNPKRPATPANAHLPTWRTAAECIDWSLPMCSIFATKQEAKVWAKLHGYKQPPRRPLSPNTLKRIAQGIDRFVLNGKPYIINLRGTSEAHLAASATGLEEPLHTISASGTHHALIVPTLIQTGFGERKGQAPRCLDLNMPLGTIVAGGSKHALIAAFIAKHYGGPNGKQTPGSSLDSPMGTITAKDHHALVAATLLPESSTPEEVLNIQHFKPIPETGKLVAAFLTKYHASGGQWQGLDEPMHAITTKDEFSLITVEIDGQTYAIVDICMRMLKPHELAKAMSFPDDFKWIQENGKPLLDDDIVKMVGNACPIQTVKEFIKGVVSVRPEIYQGMTPPPSLKEVVNG